MIGGNPMREVFSRGFGQAGPLLENDFRNVRQLREEIGRNDQVRIGHQGRRRPRRRLSSVRHSRNLRRFGAPASDVRYRRVPQRRTHLRGLRQEYQRGPEPSTTARLRRDEFDTASSITAFDFSRCGRQRSACRRYRASIAIASRK